MRRSVYFAPKGCVPFASTQNNKPNGVEKTDDFAAEQFVSDAEKSEVEEERQGASEKSEVEEEQQGASQKSEVPAKRSDEPEKSEVVKKRLSAADKIGELTQNAIEIVLNAYREVSSLLGATIGEKTVADDCKGYIKGKLVSLGEKGIAAANEVDSLKGVHADFNAAPVSLKLCMLADKRTGKNYEKDFLNAVARISESIK